MTRADLFLLLLGQLSEVYDAGDRGAVDQLHHCLQTATRAGHAGADDELVAVALLHDVFRVIAPASHGEALSEAIGDRLTHDRVQVVRYHSVWQHDALHATTRAAVFGAESWYADACRLGEWDAASFDAAYPSRTLGSFVPLLRQLLDD